MFKKIVLIIFLIFFTYSCSLKREYPKPIQYTPKALSYYYYFRFLELDRKGKKEAIEALKKAIEAYPDPYLYIEGGRFYLRKRKLKEAENFVRKGLQKFPGERRLTFFLYRLYLIKDQKNNALALLKVYLKKHPKDKKALENLAVLYFETKQYNKAVKILNKISQKDATVYYLLAKCYIKLKKPERGIFYLKKAVQLNSDFLRAWAELGYQLELKNDYAGAEEVYYTLYKKGIKNDEILLKLVELNIKLNNLEKAFSFVKESKNFEFLFKSAFLFVHDNFYNYAEKVLNLISPPYPPRFFYLKAYLVYKKEKNTQKSISLLKKIPKTSSIYKEALILMGHIYFESKVFDKAIKIAKQGQKEFSDQEFWILEEQVWYFKKDYKKALEVINKALKRFPESTDLLYQKGMILYKMKEIDKSIKIMEEVLKLDPDNADALNFIGYTLAEMGKDLKRALNLINKALKKEPDNGYYLDSLAWVYFKMGDIEKAWELIKKAINAVKDDPIIWEHYGDIAFSLKNFQEAEKGYKNALKFKTETPKIVEKKLQRLLK